MPTTLEQLYTPLAAPGPSAGFPPQAAPPVGGFTPQQQAMAGALTGATPTAAPPTLPVGTGNTMYTGETPGTKSTATGGGDAAMTSQMLGITDAGNNVAGSVGTELIDRAVKTPEAMYEADVELANITEASAGIETKGGKTKTDKAGAREWKKQERRRDRKARKDAGLKGKAKREARRSERKKRRQGWGEYKDERSRAKRERKGMTGDSRPI
jgi:hypothetical protein